MRPVESQTLSRLFPLVGVVINEPPQLIWHWVTAWGCCVDQNKEINLESLQHNITSLLIIQWYLLIKYLNCFKIFHAKSYPLLRLYCNFILILVRVLERELLEYYPMTSLVLHVDLSIKIVSRFYTRAIFLTWWWAEDKLGRKEKHTHTGYNPYFIW